MRRFCFLLGLCVLMCNCEDTKKASKTEVTKEAKTKDSVVIETAPTIPKRAYDLPLLTEQNADSLLLEYGKTNPETRAVITTSYGDIELELYKDTPVHRANFVYLVKHGYFERTFFHRVVSNFIIQAGNSDNASTNKKRAKIGKYRLSAELDNGRIHKRGTISGAKEYRENPDKKSAPFEFFIFLGPKKSTGHLNGNYTIFGRVTKGMDVVDTIANVAADEGQWPLSNIYIDINLL